MKLITKELDILFEDNHLIIVNKPCGILVQGDKTGDIPLLEIIKKYIKKKYDKKGNVYVGLVNRIDRPTSGIVIFAKTSKALERMNAQFREKLTDKSYIALVHGKLSNGDRFQFQVNGTFQMARLGAYATVRTGFDHYGLFANYNLTPLFKKEATGLVYPLTFGVSFNFQYD